MSSSEKMRYVLGIYTRRYDDSVLLIRKNHPAWMKGLLNGLGGKIESQETPLQAMVREFREECGILLSHNRCKLFCVLRGKDFEVHCYHIEIHPLDGEPLTVTDEEVSWYKRFTLPLLPLVSNLEWLVAMTRSNQLDWPYQVNEQSGVQDV